MRIISFSVKNYRSITSSNVIALQDFTVLVGKNNEGKSNFLNALNVAMNAIIQHGSARLRLRFSDIMYQWDRDFPIKFQERKNNTDSVFNLTFQLSESENKELMKLLKIRCNGVVPIEVKIGKSNIPKVRVQKQGTRFYNEHSEEITSFISQRININYIQAIRTEEMAIEALQNAVNSRLDALYQKPEYKKATELIESLYKQSLDEIASQLVDPLKVFLPSINNVYFESESITRVRTRNFDVIIDDGSPTSIKNKGDGIKSLATLAILKEWKSLSGASVIAIEEPESHLHPGAIHNLVEVISKLSENNQVIISTHNPLFVRVNSLCSNIIIDHGKVKVAKNIDEIRDILGVLVSDNLKDAKYVLVVEGESDQRNILKLLPMYSEKIKQAMDSNSLIIHYIHGTKNLVHELNVLRSSICDVALLLDNDDPAKKAAEEVLNKGLITHQRLCFAICKGLRESEFEDCIQPKVYADVIQQKYGVNIIKKQMSDKAKWSERMNRIFRDQCAGELSKDRLAELKFLVADQVVSSELPKESIICEQKTEVMNRLVYIIESMIDGN